MSYILRRKGYGEGLVDVALFTNTGLTLETAETQPKEAEYVFRWGCTANVYARKTVNSAESIHRIFDKVGFRKTMQVEGLCPKTWFSIEEWIISEHGFPVLVRKNNHSRSEAGNYYISEIIEKQHEYRVMFVSGRVIGVIEKRPRDRKAISWGCVVEGEYDYIQWENWPLEMLEVAMKAADLSGGDFGAIDIITDHDRSYVLEINSACWLSPYFCKIFVQAFDYIVKNGKDHIPREPNKGYRGYIHPSRPLAAGVAL